MAHQRKIPNFAYEVHPDITMEELCRLEDIVMICETSGHDTDGLYFYVYTIDGILDDRRIAVQDHVRKEVYGATVGGDVMIIHAKDRKEADFIVREALDDTINMLKVELEVRGTLEIGPNAGTIASVEAVGRPH